MTKYIGRLALFLIISVCVAYSLDQIVSAGLRDCRHAEFGSWHDIYNSRVDSDLIILGSSRAMAHISPQILSGRLDISAFNLGFNGYHFPMQRVRYEEFLAFNRQPSVMVLAVGVTSLHDRVTVFQYEQFLPYFHREKLIDAIAHYDGFDPFDRWLSMYRYRGRSDLLTLGVRVALGGTAIESERQRGYLGRDTRWDGTFDVFAHENAIGYQSEIDPAVRESLDEFVGQQSMNGTQVIMVFTPEYQPGQKLCRNRKEVVRILNTIANSHGAAFLDYSSSPVCGDRELFYNSQHLNRVGAEWFSKMLADDIALILEVRSGAK
ncbi:hypothetical protein EC9_30840 [Rosistilla ulvae]|uniref:Uncharacterized protein n=1 Tax=Rosistilla ulvae TaxID=1930277 RepID=A0A517M224_9BACT|nr:hypothetical protein [Rosistilla ulvae]QDS88889.1 hypothetical protein EC9_30840 [Rosistilla ulvae]